MGKSRCAPGSGRYEDEAPPAHGRVALLLIPVQMPMFKITSPQSIVLQLDHTVYGYSRRPVLEEHDQAISGNPTRRSNLGSGLQDTLVGLSQLAPCPQSWPILHALHPTRSRDPNAVSCMVALQQTATSSSSFIRSQNNLTRPPMHPRNLTSHLHLLPRDTAKVDHNDNRYIYPSPMSTPPTTQP